MSENDVLRINVFISSPSDLGPERMALKQMIERFNDEPDYRGRFRFHPFIYEAEITETDLQGMDWQQYINLYGQPLAETQLVIGMVWSRLGHELPNFINPVTGRAYRSGTEYELFTAADARHQYGLPAILFYQCNRTLTLPQGKDDQVREVRRQVQLAHELVRDLQDEHIVSSPICTFSNGEELLRQVCADLAEILPEIAQRMQMGVPRPVSTLPALPVEFVPRYAELEAIISAVQHNPVTILHGLPGQGKTVMARAMCDAVSQQFPEGVLWATLGQQADLARVQREWILHLHGNLSVAHDAASAHQELLRCLAGKTVLLVLDDVWQPFDAQTLIADLPAPYHVLMTTRNARLLPNVPLIELGPMSPADSRELLRQASKGQVNDPHLLDAIAERLGHLALALKIVGTRLVSYSWEDIQAQLSGQQFSDLAVGQRNVYLSIEASVRFLPPDQQQRYRELVAFPPDEPLVEAAVARLWQSTAQVSTEATHYLLTLFQSLALIQRDSLLHDLQRDYLVATTGADERLAWQQALIASYGPAESWATLPDDGYAWRWFAWHLAQANRTNELHTLLLDATYLENKIAHVQSTALASDFALLSGDADLRLLDRIIALGSHVLDDEPKELQNQVMGRSGTTLVSRMRHWPSPRTPYLRLDSRTLNQAGGDLLRIMPGGGHTCRFSPDGKLVLTVSPKVLQLWDVATGTLLRTFQGHTKTIWAGEFSPDGGLIISASDDQTLRLWDAATGANIHILHHENRVRSCAFSPDGQSILSASTDDTLRLWDVSSGESIFILRQDSNPQGIRSCAFSPDGGLVLSGGDDGTARLWNVATGDLLHTFRGHSSPVKHSAFSPDSSLVLTATDYSGDQTIQLWDVATGSLRHSLEGHTDMIRDCVFSADGKLILSGGNDLTTRVWNVATGETLHIFEIDKSSVMACAFSPDSRFALSASAGHTLWLWDVRTGALLHTFQGHADSVHDCAFSSDGKLIASVSGDGTTRLWDTTVRTAAQTLSGHIARINSCQFSSDGTMVVTASDDTTVRLWTVQTGEVFRLFQGHQQLVTDAVFSPDDRLIVSASGAQEWMLLGPGQPFRTPHALLLWEVATGAIVDTFREYDRRARDCLFSPDGRFVLSCDDTGAVSLWDRRAGLRLPDISGRPAFRRAFAFSPDSRSLLSVGTERTFTLLLWDLTTWALVRTFHGHTDWVNDCEFSPDGRYILSASDDATVRLWDVAARKEVHVFQGHTYRVYACAFSPDGTRAVSASGDMTLRLWDVATGAALQTFQGHTREVHSCLFTPDGEDVLSASADGSLRLWHAATGKEIDSWKGGDSRPRRIALSRDGTHIVAGDEGGGVHFLTIVHNEYPSSTSHQR
jgi:WD40 repeat protein